MFTFCVAYNVAACGRSGGRLRSCLPGLRRGGGGRQAGAAVLSCLVWWCELSRPDRQAGAFCVCLCRSVSGGAVRPPDALRRRTHLSGGRADSIHTATPDTTRLPRPPVDRRRRDAGQAGSYAAARPTAHTQRRCRPTPRKM